MTSRALRLRRARTGLGIAWILDGLLTLQPGVLEGGLSGVVGATAMGQPAGFAHLLSGAGGALAKEPVLFGVAVASIQVALGVAIAVPARSRIALWFSVPWALSIWVFGEGLAMIPSGFAMLPTGAPGPALLYATVAVILLVEHGGAKRCRAGPLPGGTAGGRVERRGEKSGQVALWSWIGLWLVAAGLQLEPMFSLGFKLQANLVELALGEPGPLAALDRTIGRSLGSKGTAVTVVLVGVELLAASLPLLRGSWRRPTLWMIGGACGLFWVLGENLGGLFSGTASDPGTMPVVVLLAYLLPTDAWRKRAPGVSSPACQRRAPRTSLPVTPASSMPSSTSASGGDSCFPRQTSTAVSARPTTTAPSAPSSFGT